MNSIKRNTIFREFEEGLKKYETKKLPKNLSPRSNINKHN